MKKPKTDFGELQAIQFQIAKFIDKYRAESAEEVVAELKKSVTYLNSAKLAIMDRDIAAGILIRIDPEDVEAKK